MNKVLDEATTTVQNRARMVRHQTVRRLLILIKVELKAKRAAATAAKQAAAAIGNDVSKAAKGLSESPNAQSCNCWW